MEDDDILRFEKAMKLLSGRDSVLIKVDERTKVAQVRPARDKPYSNQTVFFLFIPFFHCVF